jgi:transposase
VGKFCGQASELGIAEEWYARTALEDFCGIPVESINDDRLCAHLMERYRQWFGVRFEFLLYDVTSTYFVGQAQKNTKAARGCSRDQRSDCKQVCIGLVCTPEGLPLNFEVFTGNRADVATVEDIVRKMEERFGQAERIWVMDRGMVSEADISFLRERQALYIVGTPKSQLRAYEAALAEKENWVDVEHGVEARLVDHPDGEGKERYVLCRSTARGAKERAMLERQMTALTEEILKLDRSLQRRPQGDLDKIGRRIGRWQGKHPAAARLLHVTLRKDPAGRACGLQLCCPVREGGHPLLTKGAYLLPTTSTVSQGASAGSAQTVSAPSRATETIFSERPESRTRCNGQASRT